MSCVEDIIDENIDIKKWILEKLVLKHSDTGSGIDDTWIVDVNDIMRILTDEAEEERYDREVEELQAKLDELKEKPDTYWKKELEKENKSIKDNNHICFESCMKRRVGREKVRAILMFLRNSGVSEFTRTIIDRGISEIDGKWDECKVLLKVHYKSWNELKSIVIERIQSQINSKKIEKEAKTKVRLRRLSDYKTLKDDIDRVLID